MPVYHFEREVSYATVIQNADAVHEAITALTSDAGAAMVELVAQHGCMKFRIEMVALAPLRDTERFRLKLYADIVETATPGAMPRVAPRGAPIGETWGRQLDELTLGTMLRGIQPGDRPVPVLYPDLPVREKPEEYPDFPDDQIEDFDFFR